MRPRTAALARWTGRGFAADLLSSVKSVLDANRFRGRSTVTGNTVIIEGRSPVTAAGILRNLPGVAWVGVGFSIVSLREASEAGRKLAKAYLRRGDGFSVSAEVTGDASASDLGGVVSSAILEAVKGSRASESPKVKIRAAFDGVRGVVGVEVSQGPGGLSMGNGWATCLVSGGMHSSLMAWEALVAGYRVRLLHLRGDDEGLRAVGRLYAEFSHRVDPRGLALTVIEGGGEATRLASRLAESRGPVFSGCHRGVGRAPKLLERITTSPLFLLPEEDFQRGFDRLGVKAAVNATGWETRGGKSESKSYEGWAEDVSAVIEGLR